MAMKRALVIVDVQNDFCPGGALPVKDGDMVVLALNRYIELFKAAGAHIYATRDWHPRKTIHFKEYGGKWPPHCVQGTGGAEFHPDLKLPRDAVIITKGACHDEDSYSGFQGKDREGWGLGEALRAAGIGHIYVGGLATDYCVRATVFDGIKEGFKVTLLLDAVKGVDVKEDDSKMAIAAMRAKGAETATFEAIGQALDERRWSA
ncbi:MAG: nicotinamidase [Deltaproteobacteria bacterium]|nr:nicotinamidase [Deltaproteobacteria bacterium]